MGPTGVKVISGLAVAGVLALASALPPTSAQAAIPILKPAYQWIAENSPRDSSLLSVTGGSNDTRAGKFTLAGKSDALVVRATHSTGFLQGYALLPGRNCIQKRPVHILKQQGSAWTEYATEFPRFKQDAYWGTARFGEGGGGSGNTYFFDPGSNYLASADRLVLNTRLPKKQEWQALGNKAPQYPVKLVCRSFQIMLGAPVWICNGSQDPYSPSPYEAQLPCPYEHATKR